MEGRRESTTSSHHLNSIRADAPPLGCPLPDQSRPGVRLLRATSSPTAGPRCGARNTHSSRGSALGLAERQRQNHGRGHARQLLAAGQDDEGHGSADARGDGARRSDGSCARNKSAKKRRRGGGRTWSAWPRSAAAASSAPRRRKGLLKPRKPRERKLEPASPVTPPPPAERPPLPPVPTHIELPRARVSGDDFPADRLAQLFPARTRRAVVGFQPVGRPALPAVLPRASGWITNCARRCACWAPCAAARCSPMRSGWARPSRPGWCSRNC